VDTHPVELRFRLLEAFFDERSRRLFAAAESIALGRGGITAVAKATGVSRRAINVGLKELADPSASTDKRIRKEGGGRKRAVDT
jgi:DNA-binding phage protein